MERRSHSSPEYAQQQRDEVFTRLEQAVGAIQDSESFQAYLSMQAKFHHYSPNNVALILWQYPEASMVAGYNRWLELHRFVRRGEKAIKILAPMTKREELDDGSEQVHRFFRPVSVFDVSQTDGEPLPTLSVPTLEGEEGPDVFDKGLALAQSQSVRIRLARPGEFPDSRHGDYAPRELLVRLRVNPTPQMAKTTLHELGHHYHLMMFGGESAVREERETVAEGVAFVVAHHLGLATGDYSFGYIASWALDKPMLKQQLGNIQKVSAAMIDGIEAATGNLAS
jgi:hypothetical protein